MLEVDPRINIPPNHNVISGVSTNKVYPNKAAQISLKKSNGSNIATSPCLNALFIMVCAKVPAKDIKNKIAI